MDMSRIATLGWFQLSHLKVNVLGNNNEIWPVYPIVPPHFTDLFLRHCHFPFSIWNGMELVSFIQTIGGNRKWEKIPFAGKLAENKRKNLDSLPHSRDIRPVSLSLLTFNPK